MRTILDGLAYPIVVADDAAKEIGDGVVETDRAAIVYDRRVAARVAAVEAALRGRGVEVVGSLGVTAGERRKRLGAATTLFEWLAACGADRRTTLFAIGGGTLSDLGGFVAATFHRGIPWAAVPTTVLGMVDASIGGKTGVDVAGAKNLVGAFWDPTAVIADLAALSTLPLAQRRTGMAEIIKAGIVADASLIAAAAAMRPRAAPGSWRPLVAAAARAKIQVVAADPRESGSRAALNLGHTVGHALEGASNFTVSHGEAVAVGLRAAGLLSLRRALWSAAEHRAVLAALHSSGLPLWVKPLALDEVLAAMRCDKKRRDGRHVFVLPIALGAVKIGVEVAEDEITEVVRTCMSPPAPSEWSP